MSKDTPAQREKRVHYMAIKWLIEEWPVEYEDLACRARLTCNELLGKAEEERR